MRTLLFITGLLGILFNPLAVQAAWQIDLSIDGHAMKQTNQALTVQMEIIAGDDPDADIYIALQQPDKSLLFLSADSLFAEQVDFSLQPRPYVQNLVVSQHNGLHNGLKNVLLNITQLPRGIQTGDYYFYTVATIAGADVFDRDLWLSPLSRQQFYYSNNDNSLPIPPQMTGVLNEKGEKVFDLTLQKGQKSFLPDTQTDTFGVNGDYLGPTIRVSKADKVAFNVTNKIGETTTIHWHGAHIPAKMDGGPHQLIEADSTWQPFFDIKQEAATLWYHPHLEGKTAEHVYKGLAGLFIIDDEASDGLPLPRNYGVDDIPMVVQDRRIAQDGTMTSQIKDMKDMMGLRGQYMLVNGALTPTLDSKAQVIRLRLLNASNARIYNFGFENDREFYQIASGGGLLEAPAAMTRLRLAPGERAEILLDLRENSGQYLTLKSYSNEIIDKTIVDKMMRDELDNQTFTIMHIRVGESGDNGLSIPNQLVTIERLQEADAVVTRPFVLKENMGAMDNMTADNIVGISESDRDLIRQQGDMGNMNDAEMSEIRGLIGINNQVTFENLSNMGMFTINDKVMDMNRIDETVRLGDTEIWEISNESEMAHPFHIHDIQFQILDRNGVAPEAGEAGWKDTVLVFPEEKVRIITRFEDFADPDVPYMYHCHILEHEDAGMMGQFVVIE